MPGQQELFGSDDYDSYLNEANLRAMIIKRLEKALLNLLDRGYDTFLNGLAEGFDLLAAEAVIDLKAKYGGITLIGAVPHPGQARRFSPESKALYGEVTSQCDRLVTICPSYIHDCFHRRNDYLVDNASALVCFYNGSKGGTQYTVKRAFNNKLEIINLFSPLQPQF